MKILITGAYGSGATYLIDYLKENVDCEIHGIVRWNTKLINGVIVHECDLTDMSSVITTLGKIRPNYIFHLAANARVYSCFNQPLAVMNNNITGTLNLYEAIKLIDLDPKIVFCSTSECYGQVKPEDTPIKETHPLNPVNIYAVSKLAQEKTALSYWYCYKIKSVITRAFTYINPKRKDIYSSSFARQVVAIERGQQDYVSHGNLDSIRTIVDVRDIAEAYWLSSQMCEFGDVYNIGGGTTLSVGEFLEKLIAKAKCHIKCVQDPALIRPKDVTLQIPDVTKFTNQTGWKPRYTIDESVDFLLDYYRNE